ncbi:hypothetical protein [Brumimicrobium aurantiacum]|uniref:Uncharacterized protein n=1 Tax=Brumimicrobium aurantiacum TaxID=1737063 RepID=A0A3E1F0T7_9FLAO|nr:hypothetical protein [Brumimicrobium aurantiacum]RFC55353.1 hypothetical protein DXU93_04770 [Brumimicrobium aurantiacum]
MTINNNTISKGFVLAGLTNSSVLIFSKLFTNPVIAEFDTTVMSNFGLLMIFIWGLAYISIAKNYQQVKWLVAVFAIEKFIYGFIWLQWHLNHSVSAVFEKNLLAGVFYSIYGINDWLFFIFFSFVFIRLMRK